MNGNFILLNIIRFSALVCLQIAVFSHMEIFGVASFPYILFIILYPVNTNKYGFLFACFLLGLTIDMFLDSGGTHSAACLITAALRPNLFKFSFGLSYEYQIIKISVSPFREQFVFVGISALTHHIVLFFLEAFSLKLFAENLLNMLFSTMITVVFSLLIINLLKHTKR